MNISKIIKSGLISKLTRKTLHNYLFALLLGAAVCPAADAQETNWGFTLSGGPAAQSPDSDEVIRMTGSGSFNSADGTIAGGGSFAIFNASDEMFLGGPIFRGTWKPTSFISFESDGGPNPGLQGGTLQIKVTVFFEAGLKPEFKGLYVPDCTLTVICPFVNGSFVESDDAIHFEFPPFAGGEEFTIPIGGRTLFHLR